MKRYGYIYPKIWNIRNINEAHFYARRRKSHYPEVKKVNNCPWLLNDISESLRKEEYKTSSYRTQAINDRGKERIIHILPYYPDRIVHWAIMLQIQDIVESTFIYDTYASIPGKGIHKAIDRVNKTILEGGKYCLKLDVKKYFPSIDQGVLYEQLKRKFKDRQLLDLLYEIINSVEFGLPIGSYLSQWLANFYLSFFDHAVCEKFGLPYFRYMDDIVIFSTSKKQLWEALRFITAQLNKLKLEVKSNYQVFPSIVRGVDFLGYRCFGEYTLLRKRIASNIKKKYKAAPSKKKMQAMMSYKGWADHCNSYRFSNKYIKQFERIKT